jgi:adenylosuccinate lyase
MIPRYTTSAMARIWSDEAKIAAWIDVERAVCQAWARRGVIERDELAVIEEQMHCDLQRMAEIEAEVHHDVIAFLTAVAERVGPASRHIHLGMTSSDLLDTAGALRAAQAFEVVLEDLDALRAAVGKRVRDEAGTLIMGRTHGMYAEPMTLGLKLAVWYAELGRHREQSVAAREAMAVGKLSGAVGTCAHISPEMEEEVLASLGLRPEPVASQIVHRDRHAQAVTALALLGCSLEKFALEVRHLQRSEVAEAAEPFTPGQKGSSAMPHKQNPILCERICGLARVVRGNALAAMENVAVWHERDISHSSAERVILPDTFSLIDYALSLMLRIVSGLSINRRQMEDRVRASAAQWGSQAVLLALISSGLTREAAYEIVQAVCMKAQSMKQVVEALLADDRVTSRLSREAIEQCFAADRHVAHVQRLLERAGLGAAAAEP